jgi:hypothetical protein
MTPDFDKPSRSMAVREITAISSNCCSCRSLTVTFEICELRHSLEGWAASCSCVIGRFCHIPPLSSQLAAAGKSNALVWRVRPDPPLRGVGLRLAARPSRRASTGRLSGALSGRSGSNVEHLTAALKGQFGRVRATISSSPRLRRTCGRLPSGPPRYPRVRGAARRYARTQRECSLNSARDRIPRLARWLRISAILISSLRRLAGQRQGPGAAPRQGYARPEAGDRLNRWRCLDLW